MGGFLARTDVAIDFRVNYLRCVMSAPREQIEAWYRKFGPLIYARCRTLLHDDALAQDATQDIFVRLLGCAQLPDDRSATLWIQSVTRNHCFNQLRNRGRQAIPSEHLPEVALGDLEAELDQRRLAQQLFERAPAPARESATLYYLNGINQDEVARRIGVSRRTVSSRMNDFTARCLALLGARANELARV